MAYSDAFLKALAHAMLYEVGPNFNPADPETMAGLIATAAQRKKVGYTNTSGDNGGETKFGVAKNANPAINVTALTYAQAQDIYFYKYWLPSGCNAIDQIGMSKLAILHFDGCVNIGVSKAGRFLQEVLGVEQDGKIGNITITALKTQKEAEICSALCARRAAHYQAIVEHNPAQAKFLNGWLRRIHEVRDYVLKP